MHADATARWTRRAATTTTATLLLTLCGATAALADDGPLPLPLPQPIVDTVDVVTDTLGVTDPLAADAPATHKHKRAKTDTPDATLPTVDRDLTSAATVEQPAPRQPDRRHVRTAAPELQPAQWPGWVSRQIRDDQVRAPLTAPAGSVVAAGATPTVLSGSSAMTSLPQGGDAQRALLFALALMAAGVVATGHLKLAQDRLARWAP